ncbi:Serine palmitoyltransferase 1 [Diplonema papillatum]|nr:Serine palmitoyltransferase 1 [Diplonema papillatum]
MTHSESISFTREIWSVLISNPSDIFLWLGDEVRSNPIHVTIEVVCILYIFYMWRQKPHKMNAAKPVEISAEERERRVSNWRAEPLRGFSAKNMEPQKVVLSVSDDQKTLEIEGVGDCVDYSTFNFLRLSKDPRVVENSLAAVDHYGVGSCGPRGFYGTLQPHLVLEEQLKTVYDTSAAIIYSFQYATLSSILPAFAGREDVLVVDKGVSVGVLTGVHLSRAQVFWYDHNDMNSLEATLSEVAQMQKKKVTRRWIITEGLFRNYGDICRLDEVVELKRAYKFRLMVEDSFGCGVLGKRGLGVCDHFDMDVEQSCEVYVSAMDTSLGSIGGFCVGCELIVDHQRLRGAGYCFSASLPAYAAVAATSALEILLAEPWRVARVRENSKTMHQVFSAAGLHFTNSEGSPIFHVTCPASVEKAAAVQKLHRALVELLQEHKIAVTRPFYTEDEKFAPPPSLRIVTSCACTPAETEAHAKTVAAVIKKHCS